jgi:hypothetical protein
MVSIGAHTSASSASVSTRSRSTATVATGRPTNGLWGTLSRLAAQLNAARAYANERAAVTAFALLTNLSSTLMMSALATRAAGREDMFDRALRLCTVTLAPMRKLELDPVL